MAHLKFSDLTEPAADVARSLSAYAHDFVVPTVRLGVTGLSRAGKTVFITALVRNLLADGRLPFFSAQADGRIGRVYLEPQPDDDVPRFSYEDHLARLGATDPQWPDGTNRISQLRLTIEYQRTSSLRRLLTPALGPGRLNIDIIDYPGEWLIDLVLLEQDYDTWSREALAAANTPHRQAAARPFLEFIAALDRASPLDEAVALTGARLYTAYLEAQRAKEPALSTLGPGRFLMPGDLAGSPLLTFFPLPESGSITRSTEGARASLGGQLGRRFESYKSYVVKPFFRNHFSRIDRQIVLIDALAALNAGPGAVSDLNEAITSVLSAFRPGANTIASRLFGRRVDRILFAATKADHLHRSSHDRLELLLSALTDRAMARALFAGAEVKTLAMAAIRSTREAEAGNGDAALPCIIGTPIAGERVADVIFDGRTETALFPGDLPDNPETLINGTMAQQPVGAEDIRVLKFKPPRLALDLPDGRMLAPPHIRLDRAIEFLIGDKLA